MFEIFKNKKVLVTGHTGFKGSWLSKWLLMMRAKVYGVSLSPNTTPNHFDVINLKNNMDSFFLDITDFEKLSKKIVEIKPDFLFHLAAQPIVGTSYEDPILTYRTNVLGTLNVLESLKMLKNKCTAIIVTSDKCYENKEWIWGYKETDQLGGIDPYSASKASCEILIRSHTKSFFSEKSNILIGVGRAGNVIGGGDWSKGRIVPDAILSWIDKKDLILRNPSSTRPWQHVLEPLSGYLQLAFKLSKNKKLHGEQFNFGPSSEQNHTVSKLIEEISTYWPNSNWQPSKNLPLKHESGLLKLNCDKSQAMINWGPTLSFNQTVQMTVEWYKSFYIYKKNMDKFTEKQINFYNNLYKKRFNA